MALVGLALAGCSQAHSDQHFAADATKVAELRKGGAGAGSTGASAQPTGTGWGSLKGKFVFAGSPPSLPADNTGGKDVAVCGTSVPNDQFLIDGSSKGIRNVLVFARRVSRVEDSLKATPPVERLFDQEKCFFKDRLFAVSTRDTLLIKNSDAVGHNTKFDPPGQASFNATIGSGGTATYKFTGKLSEPTVASCSIHPWMKAFLMARDDPYFAVSDKEGNVAIDKLPAGEPIEFQVWHELQKGKGLQAKSEWSGGRFTLTLKDKETTDLGTISVAPSAFNF